jgi:flagellar basal body-associated protein FliL
MAADVAEAPKPQSDHEGSAPAKGKSKKKILIGGIIFVVVAVQAVVTYLLIPHSSSSSAGHKPAEKEHGAASAHESDHGHDHGHEPEIGEGDVAEVSLGSFSFSNGTAVPGVIIHVDFKLSAVTAAKQAASLEGQVKVHDARIRQAVNKIVRGSNLEELNDPNLHAIKRSIREEINRLLRKSYVNEVVITDVRTIEQ